jgi:hypothetical protein
MKFFIFLKPLARWLIRLIIELNHSSKALIFLDANWNHLSVDAPKKR